ALVVGLERRGQFGVLPRAGQPVLLLTASLFAASEPLREARRGTVVRPDYGGYCCGTCVLPRSDETRGSRPGSRIRRRWTHLTVTSGSVSVASVLCPGRVPSVCVYLPCGGHDEQSYGVSDRAHFPYRATCSFASALPFVGETSQQRQGARRAEETGR
ncbi:hypothetical protein Taro_021405, partial [Colocasia esculenta]|nr:hypothetical protein [Colocasia esculenta]